MPSFKSPSVKVMQLNLHRSHPPLQDLLTNSWNSSGMNIALVQEIPLHKGKACNVPHPLHFDYTCDIPRAGIIYNPSLDIWPAPTLSYRDCQVCSWTINKKNILVISAYWAINERNIPTTLVKAIRFAKKNKFEILVGMDANAHSPLWGSPTADARGHLLEDWLNEQELVLLNHGGAPTFVRGASQTHIDVTFVSRKLMNDISNWQVVDDESFSDHRLLSMTFGAKPPKATLKPNYNKTCWESCKRDLDSLDWETPVEPRDRASLDKAVADLQESILSITDRYTPKVAIKTNPRKSTWWNNDLRQMRRELRVTFHQYKVHLGTEVFQIYATLRQAYQSAIRKTKKSSWLKFCDEIKTVSQTSRLVRTLTRHKAPKIGLTRQADGKLTISGRESIKNLISTLFPGTRVAGPRGLASEPPQPTQALQHADWLNKSLVSEAINSFDLGKTPGPDGIRVNMLRCLPDKGLEFLTGIYKRCIELSHVPSNWLQTRAIFLPKIGKRERDDPKSFRPISLTSFLFKTLEKLFLRKLDRDGVYPHKLSPYQHGFRSNRSTDTALSQFVNEVEVSLENKLYHVAVLLDIKGAFDHLDPNLALRKLDEWGADPGITKTLQYYYTHRSITTAAPGGDITVYPTIGSGQGGVISPLLWNVAFDEAATLINSNNTFGTLFADDTNLNARGGNINQLYFLLQTNLNRLAAWMDQAGLEVNVKKSCVICFRNKDKPAPDLHLKWKGALIPTVGKAVYLGLTIDQHLSWNPHMDKVMGKAKAKMVQVNKALSKVWGPSPKLTHWIYTSVVRPIVSYGAHIWSHSINNSRMDKMSRSIQRWALTKLGPIREKTPTAGLEILTNTPPLQFHLQESSHKTLIRFNHIGFQLEPARKGHLAKGLADIANNTPMALIPCDRTLKSTRPTFRNLQEDQPDPRNTEPGKVNIFTDGSGREGSFGCGFLIQWSNQTRVGMAAGGNYSSVFLSELRAINLAVSNLLREESWLGRVNIFSDSLSAIQAIKATTATSKEVINCWKVLQQLDNLGKWSLSWVKGHSGIPGNESADKLAKQGASLKFQGPQPMQPIPFKVVKNTLARTTLIKWGEYWNNRPDCRQTKLWFPKPDPLRTKQVLALSRKDFGLVTRWVTGHCYLARHQSLLYNNSPTCNLCQEEEETPWHLLWDCPAVPQRLKLPPDKWSVSELRDSANALSYLEVPDYN